MFKPLFNRVLVLRDPELSETKGGILIPETSKEKPALGIVISVGPEVKHLKPNDRVLFAKYSGSDIKLGDNDYLILVENDIMGTITKKGRKKNGSKRSS